MDDQGLWTLDQLTEQVGAALSVDYPGAPSGRVRSVPDRRAIRWYTTIGLVDRPAAIRGRTALYAERHLLQLVAIKRLQAEGRSLAAIQAELAGATESTLRSLARLPDHPPGPTTPAAAPRSDRFWSADMPLTSATLPAGGAEFPDPPAAGGAAFALPAAEAVASNHTRRPATTQPTRPTWPDPARDAAGSPPVSAAHRLRTENGELDLARPDQAGPGQVRSRRVEPGRAGLDQAGLDQAGLDEAGSGGSVEAEAGVDVAPAIALPGGVMVLLPPGTPYPGADDLHAIRTAAVPLLAELGRRGVIATHSTEERS